MTNHQFTLISMCWLAVSTALGMASTRRAAQWPGRRTSKTLGPEDLRGVTRFDGQVA